MSCPRTRSAPGSPPPRSWAPARGRGYGSTAYPASTGPTSVEGALSTCMGAGTTGTGMVRPPSSPELPVPAAVVTDLTRQHSRRRGAPVLANDGISLTVGAGEVFGLLGPNGAGKTTLVRQLVGVLRPDRGR